MTGNVVSNVKKYYGGQVPVPGQGDSDGKVKVLVEKTATIEIGGVRTEVELLYDADDLTTPVTPQQLGQWTDENYLIAFKKREDDGRVRGFILYALETDSTSTDTLVNRATFVNFKEDMNDPGASAYVFEMVEDSSTLTRYLRDEDGEMVIKFNQATVEAGAQSGTLHELIDTDSEALYFEVVHEDGKSYLRLNTEGLGRILDDMNADIEYIIGALDELPSDEHGYFNSSLYATPGDGTTTNLVMDDFRIAEGRDVSGENIEFVPTRQEGGVNFGNVYLEPGTYILAIQYTLQWVGNPRGTFLPKVCSVADQPFDFSYEHEDVIRVTRIVTRTTRGKLVTNIPIDADTPPMGVWVKNMEVVQVATFNHSAVAHDTTLTGTGKFADPLGVTSAAFGQVKNIPTSVSQFRTGDVIPVDGPNGPAKMSKDDLLTETAQNALAGNLAPEFDPNKPNDAGGYAYYNDEIVVYNGLLYQFKTNHSSGTWVSGEVRRYSIDAVINHLHITATREYLLAITDKNGVFLFGIKPNGEVEWQRGVPLPVYTYIANLINGVNQSLTSITNELSDKVDKVNGKSLVSDEVVDSIRVISNSEYVYAIVDDDDKLLFGVKATGEVDWQNGVPSVLNRYFSAVTDASSKDYVDTQVASAKSYADAKVLTEKERAENSEEVLQNQISAIAPVVINGGSFENFPDNEYLKSVGNLLTFKDIPATINTIGICYVHSGSSLLDTMVAINTIYVIKDFFDIDGGELTVPQGCTLLFDGGMIDNGTIIGTDTKLIYKNTCIGKDLSVSGTWSVPYITSDMVEMTSGDCKELKKLIKLCSDSLFNVVHILPGTFNITILRESDHFLSLKSNTKLIIDGDIIANPNGFEGYDIIYAQEKTNIEITGNGSVSGDADYHDYTQVTYHGTHQWGHCMRLLVGSNVRVHDLTLINATGDGLVVGCEKVFIDNLSIYHCGRQGITITDGCAEVKISNCVIHDIYRSSPMYGIDIEPNWNRVKNIEIENMSIYDCFGGIAATRVDGLVVRNVEVYDCNCVFMAHSSSSVSFDMFRCHDNKQGSFFRVYEDCSDIRIGNSIFSAISPENAFLLYFDGVTTDCSVRLTGFTETSGVPVEGSMWYFPNNHLLKYYDGTAWITIGG